MRVPEARSARPQSRGEEIANSVSHGLALLAAVAGLPVLIVSAARRSDAALVVGVSIFGASMILLYLASTVYHALPESRAKRVFNRLDHSAIFLLIAGTYTPFTLGVLRGSWGWILFGLVWGLAAVGILLKILGWARHPAISTGLYLLMGWLVLIAVQPLMTHLPSAGLWWLLAGGIAYTVGVVFFVLDERFRYAHFVWHGFVVAGTTCHFIAVIGYAG
jgi:hemolysin III